MDMDGAGWTVTTLGNARGHDRPAGHCTRRRSFELPEPVSLAGRRRSSSFTALSANASEPLAQQTATTALTHPRGRSPRLDEGPSQASLPAHKLGARSTTLEMADMGRAATAAGFREPSQPHRRSRATHPDRPLSQGVLQAVPANTTTFMLFSSSSSSASSPSLSSHSTTLSTMASPHTGVGNRGPGAMAAGWQTRERSGMTSDTEMASPLPAAGDSAEDVRIRRAFGRMTVDGALESDASGGTKGRLLLTPRSALRTTTRASAFAAAANGGLAVRTQLPRDTASIAAGAVYPRPPSPCPHLGVRGPTRRRRRSLSSSPGPYPARRLRLQSPPTSANGSWSGSGGSPCSSPGGIRRVSSAGTATGAHDPAASAPYSPVSATSFAGSPVMYMQSHARLNSPPPSSFASFVGLEVAPTLMPALSSSMRPMINGRELAIPRGRNRASSLTLLHSAATAAAVVAQAVRRPRTPTLSAEDAFLEQAGLQAQSLEMASAMSISTAAARASASITWAPSMAAAEEMSARMGSGLAGRSALMTTSPAYTGRRMPAVTKMRAKLLNRVQSMLESESSPLEQEVKKEREVHEHLREHDEVGASDLGVLVQREPSKALPWLAADEVVVGNSAYVRSRLNPEWDYFRGEPSPSPSSSCMSSPGLYPHPGASPLAFWPGSPGPPVTSMPRRGKRKASYDRSDPYGNTVTGIGSAFYKRRAASPVVHPNSPRLLIGGSPRVLPVAIPVAPSSSLSASTGATSTLTNLSLGPPLQPLSISTSGANTTYGAHAHAAAAMGRHGALINIQETDMHFSRMSLEDGDNSNSSNSSRSTSTGPAKITSPSTA
ncbi:hypothetical protein THASP1DRAFT_29643 [Thamnocephalis sphaerospora]|uniref:Uncharacterized protein n=1 Tax=Thamnocephalis sphaerospora TaxID=78915 RepID=A0A4P9XSR0_9FUNG|nr:hypothetical protein THASP1DRAFT_29643 [Thamnocephalis sphaerospora]|eukprot:RKP08551.1 hypothetical protein THASP1DRAFT_29643 [Thamnocephalis sphaerospora]